MEKEELAIYSGKKVCSDLEKIKSVWPPIVENKSILERFLNSRNFISNRNEEIEKVENKFKRYLNISYFSFFSSGASAIHSALVACDISYGDEVIVPAYTFSAPAFAVLRVGAIPIFADVKKDTYNIDENDVIRLLKKFKKVKAIIAVHMNGYPADVKKLREIADQYNVKLIEDAAQAFGAKIADKYVGTYGHIGCFSFMPSKQLASCGELGGICTNDLDLFNKANSVKTYAQKILEGDSNFYYNSFSYGFNYKPSVLNCIFLSEQLDSFNKNISIIKKNAKKLNDYIYKNISFLKPQDVEIGFEHVYHFCRYRCDVSNLDVDNCGLFRETLFDIMEREGLALRIYQTHPVYRQPIFGKVFDDECKDNYPWKFNPEYIESYKDNYTDKEHPNTLDVINNTFAIGGVGAAPNYLYNDEIVNLYIKGFKKINDNIEDVVKYYKTKREYVSPYEGIVKLSDTKGEFK